MENLGFVAVFGLVVLIGLIIILLTRYRKVPAGTALIRNGFGGTRVSFSGAFVLPILHMAQYLDLTSKSIEITRDRQDPLHFEGGDQAWLQTSFIVVVIKNHEDVLRVADLIGVNTMANEEKLHALLAPKFDECLSLAASEMNLDECRLNPSLLKERILTRVGMELDGLMLDDVSLKFLK